MSQLILMRRRIRSIETIKKITHAMRLISMSTHSRLSRQQKNMLLYHDTLSSLFSRVHMHAPQWHNASMHPDQKQKKQLLILVSANKGLCGTFNSALFAYTKNYIAARKHIPFDIICIGKKAVEFAENSYPHAIKDSFEHFSQNTVHALAQSVGTMVLHASHPYSSVVMISNKIRSFFVQYPEAETLIPFTPPQNNNATREPEELLWSHEPTALLDMLANAYLTSSIHTNLFESLLAEHAARFISMDGSTRNAEQMLEATRLRYNKLRQAKITKELTEIAGNF